MEACRCAEALFERASEIIVFRSGERHGDFLGNGPRTAVQPESTLLPPLVGSFVKQRGHRKIRPSGSSPRCEMRPQEVFGQCTTLAIRSLPLASCIQVVAELGLLNNYRGMSGFCVRKARAIISCTNVGLYNAICLFASTAPVRFGLETAKLPTYSTLVAQFTDDDYLN
jgi:hypothetical protein